MLDASRRVVAASSAKPRASAAASAVIAIDTRGAILSLNAAGQRLFGYGAAEILARNVRTLIAPDASGSDLEFYLRTGCGNRRELIGLRKDGGAFAMEMSVGATREDAETTLVVIIDDLTERNSAEAQRERLMQHLIASNENLRDFTRSAAHDLQAPSRLVSAFCSLLLERHGDALDAVGREYLQLAVRASEGMHALVDDLLHHARSDVEAPRARWFDSADCVTTAMENLREAIRATGAIVHMETMPRVFANPVRFTRVIQNLLENAIKYVPRGVAPRVRIVAGSDEGYWRFSVMDNGVGIDASDHDRAFEPFARLQAPDDYQGSGLGLTICKKIVEGFGGQFGVASKLGEGSTFTFTISRHKRVLSKGVQGAPQRLV